MPGFVGVYLRTGLHPSDDQLIMKGVYLWTSLIIRPNSKRKVGVDIARRVLTLAILPVDCASKVFFCAVLYLIYISLTANGPNVLGYQSHLLQRCHSACGHEGSSHLSPVLAQRFFIAMQVQHSYNSSTNGWILLTHVPPLSATNISQNKNPDFLKN